MLGYGQNEVFEFLDGIIGVYSCRRSANSERLTSNAGIKAGTKENGAVQNRPNSLIGMAPQVGLEPGSKARKKKNFLEYLSNAGSAVRLYGENRDQRLEARTPELGMRNQ